MTGAVVVGIDLSLTSTGIATIVNGDVVSTDRVRSVGKANASLADSARRIDKILGGILELLPEQADLAVIESPAFNATGGSAHERAGLWWLVAVELSLVLALPVATVAPMSLKLYATGNGKADKAEVVRAAQALVGWEINNDEADAVMLACMGARKLGQPADDIPATSRALKAMESAKWPAELNLQS